MLKSKRDRILAVALVMLICSLAFSLLALVYFSLQPSWPQNVTAEQESIPYEAPAPDNLAILFHAETLGCFDIFYLDFSTGKLTVTALPFGTTLEQARNFGYEINRTITCDNDGLAALIDRFGGIEMNISSTSERLRLTGNQVISYLQENMQNKEIFTEARVQVLGRFFDNIAVAGFTKEDFIFFTLHATTDISYPDFYRRKDRFPALAGSCTVVT
jgi:hypothetical protein